MVAVTKLNVASRRPGRGAVVGIDGDERARRDADAVKFRMVKVRPLTRRPALPGQREVSAI